MTTNDAAASMLAQFMRREMAAHGVNLTFAQQPRRHAMEDPAFKVGPDYLNEVFREAEIEDMRMTLSPAGQLHLDTDLSAVESINRLISGLALLYSKLYTARSAA